MRILLVEDTRDVGEAIAVRLRGLGHAVDWEVDGEAGDALLAVQAYDLVILDVNLPGLDGFSILKRLRARRGPVPVLVLTPFGGRRPGGRPRSRCRRLPGEAVRLPRTGSPGPCPPAPQQRARRQRARPRQPAPRPGGPQRQRGGRGPRPDAARMDPDRDPGGAAGADLPQGRIAGAGLRPRGGIERERRRADRGAAAPQARRRRGPGGDPHPAGLGYQVVGPEA